MNFLEQAALGDEIKRAARVNGISLATLSRRAGIPYARLLRILVGHRKPAAGELERIAELLHYQYRSEVV